MEILGWILLVVSGIGVFVTAGLSLGGEHGESGRRLSGPSMWWVLFPLAISQVAMCLLTFVAIPAGFVGVQVRFGSAVGVMHEGLNAKLPVLDSVVFMSVQTEKYAAKAEAVSHDLQDVMTEIAVNYRLDPEQAVAIYRTLGVNYIEKIAAPAVQEVVKVATARFNAEDMILKRQEVRDAISESLKARLAERGLVAENVLITNFTFSQEFTNAIEAKVVAVQRAQEAQNKLEQVKFEALQAEAKAKGAAAAAVAEAEGQAKALTIVTAAQTEANKAISSSLTQEVLQYILLDRLGKDIKVMVVPSGAPLTLPTVTP